MLIIADLASHLADAHIIGESVRQFRGPLIEQMGLNTLFKMLLEDNFVHADLHPGNILIRFKEPDFWAKAHAKFFGYANPVPRPHITLLDTGMSTSLTHQDQTALMQFFESIGNLDGAYVAETSLKMATIQQFPTKTQFVQEVVELFDMFQIHMKKHDDLPTGHLQEAQGRHEERPERRHRDRLHDGGVG